MFALSRTKRLTFILTVLITHSAFAGGPLVVVNGVPATWPETQTVVAYTLDQGRLGSLSNFQAKNLFASAVSAWNKVSTSWLLFTNDSQYLPVDVTSSNYERTVNGLDDDVNPIVFDDDGEIIDDLLGNNSKYDILGLTSVSSIGTRITKAQIILNGYFIRNSGQTQNEVFSTLLHEIGHVFGLDHAQFGRDIVYNGVESDDEAVAIMYPTSTGDNDARQSLTLDDQLALSNLYPTLYHLNSSGSIAGTVKRSGRELPGVNVIARNISDPLNKVTSTVTGTSDPNTGAYELKGLPPGQYEVMVEAVDSQFTGTSSVGQYATNIRDTSFQQPVRAEFYNDNDLTLEGRSSADFVTVSKLRTTTGIDINVDSQTEPSDERIVRLLAIGSSAPGAAAASSTTIPFLLAPNGDENSIVLTFSFSASTYYSISVQRERGNGSFDEETFSQTANEATIRIGEGSDIPLEQTRYFIEFTNYTSYERTFTVSVQENQPVPTATPTFTPSPTETPTQTQTPTATPTGTVTPTPTFTPTYTPKPERTPTPLPPAGDVNLDGLVNSYDVFYFAQDWQKSVTSADFRSNLATNRSLIIDYFDLLKLIESHK